MEPSNEAGQIKNVSGNTTQMVHSKSLVQSVPINLQIKKTNQLTPSKECDLKTTLQMGQTNHSVLQTSQTNYPFLLAQSNLPSVQIKQVKQPYVQIRPINQPVLQVGHVNHLFLQTSQTNYPVLLGQSTQSPLQIKQITQPSVQTSQTINRPFLQVGQANHSVLPTSQMINQPVLQLRQANHSVLQTSQMINQPVLQVVQANHSVLQTSQTINRPVLQVGQANHSVLQTSQTINQPVLQVGQANHSVLQTSQMINQPVLQVGQANHSVLQTSQMINQPVLQLRQANHSVLQTSQMINQPILQVGQPNYSALQTSQTYYPVLQKPLNQHPLQIKQPSIQTRQVNYSVGHVNKQALTVGQVNQQALKAGKVKNRTLLMSQCKQENLPALKFAHRTKQALQLRQCKQDLEMKTISKQALLQLIQRYKQTQQFGQVKQQPLKISKVNKSAQHIGQVNQSVLQTGHIIQPTLSMKNHGQVNQPPLQKCNVYQHTLHMGRFIQSPQKMTNTMSFLNKDLMTVPIENSTGLDSFSTVVKSEPQEITSTDQNPIPQCVVVTFCKDPVEQTNVENDIKTESSDISNQEHMETEFTNTADELDDKNKVLTENVEFTSVIETTDEVKTEPVTFTCLNSSTIDCQTKVENVEYMSIVANNDQIKTEHVEYSSTQTAESKTDYMETTEQQCIKPCDFVDDSKRQKVYDNNALRIQLETNKIENEDISDTHEESGENIGSVEMSKLSKMKPGYIPKACNTSDQDTCTEKIPNSCNVNTDCISKTSYNSIKDTSSGDVHTSSKVSIGYTSRARKSQHKEVSIIHSNKKSHWSQSSVTITNQPLPKIKVNGKIYNESEKQGIQYYTTLGKTLMKNIQTVKEKSAIDQNILSNFSLSGSSLLKGQWQEKPLKIITILAQKSISNEPNQQVGMTLHSKPSVIKITPPQLKSVMSESSRSVTSVTDQTISPEISTKDTPVDGEACLSVAHESPHSEGIHEQQTSIVEKNPTIRLPISNVFKPELKLSNSDNLDLNNQSKLNMQTTNRHGDSVFDSSSLPQMEDSPNPTTQSSLNSATQSLSTVKIHSKSQKSTSDMDTDLYACDMCNTSFKTKPELTKHVTICHDTVVPSEEIPSVKLYQCGICNNDEYSFNAVSMLSKHMRSFHPGIQFDPKAKDRRRRLRASRRIKECLKDIKTVNNTCPTNSQSYSNCIEKSLPSLSIQSADPAPQNGDQPESVTKMKFICRICFSSCTRKSEYKKHLLMHHRNAKTSLLCHICGRRMLFSKSQKYGIFANLCDCLKQCLICFRVFDDSNDFKLHMIAHNTIRKSILSCKKSLFSFSRKYSVGKYTSCEKITKPFLSETSLYPICGQLIPSRYFALHKRIRNPQFECSVCRKCFARKYRYTDHLRLHSGERPVSCDLCGKLLRTLDNLVYHMKSHLGEYLYNCDVCNKKFILLGDLRRHMRTKAHRIQRMKKYQ